MGIVVCDDHVSRGSSRYRVSVIYYPESNFVRSGLIYDDTSDIISFLQSQCHAVAHLCNACDLESITHPLIVAHCRFEIVPLVVEPFG